MEIRTKKWTAIFTNPMIALVVIGIIMMFIASFLPSDTDEDIKRALMFLGFSFAVMGFCIIALPYFMKEMPKRYR